MLIHRRPESNPRLNLLFFVMMIAATLAVLMTFLSRRAEAEGGARDAGVHSEKLPDASAPAILPQPPRIEAQKLPTAEGPPPTPGELLGDGVQAAKAVKTAIKSRTLTTIALAGALGLALVIGLIKKFGPNVIKSSNTIRLILLFVSGLAAVLMAVSEGLPFQKVMDIAMVGPFAMFFREMWVLFFGKKGSPDEQQPAPKT